MAYLVKLRGVGAGRALVITVPRPMVLQLGLVKDQLLVVRDGPAGGFSVYPLDSVLSARVQYRGVAALRDPRA